MYELESITKSALSSSKVKNKLMKFWATFASQVDVPMDMKRTDGYWLSLDDVLEDTVLDTQTLIKDLFQKQHLNDYVLNEVETSQREQYLSITLSDLLNTFNNEDLYGLRQFNVKESRVGSIAFDMMDKGSLFMPIELGYTVEQGPELIITSGRHRTFALLSIFSVLEDWEDLMVTVKVTRFNSQSELAYYIQAANGSRAMSTVEQTMLWYNEHNLDATDSNSLFVPCKQSLSAFNKACGQLFALVVPESEVVDLQQTTLGKVGQSFAGKLRSRLDKKARVFLKDPGVAYEIATSAVNTFIDNYEAFRSMVKTVETTKDGESIYYNFARKYNIVAEELSKAIASAYEEALTEKVLSREQALAQKKAQTKVKSTDRKKASIEETLALLKQHGVAIGDVDINELVA